MNAAADANEEFTPATTSELCRFVQENAQGASPSPLLPVGGRTSLNYGFATRENATRVSTSKLTQIIDYPARDMTITVEAGIRMDELGKLLKNENQRLPVDIAQSQRATLGGVIATNTSGPRRFGHGTMRDFVIGISAVDAEGRLFSAGGRVVKNVAGYDLCKLMVGSLGTLGIITQVTLKLRPVTTTTALVWQCFDSFNNIDETLEALLTSQTRPIALEVLGPKAAGHVSSNARCQLPADSPTLIVGFEGSETETKWQVDRLKQECEPFNPTSVDVVTSKEADNIWESLTDYATWSDDPLTFQANLPASKTIEFVEMAVKRGVSIQAHAGNGIVVGHMPDDSSTLDACQQILESLRAFARQHRGNVTILQCDADWKASLPVFGEAEASWPLMKKVKQELDPHDILSPGRFL